jgi:uncharacterized protein YcfL
MKTPRLLGSAGLCLVVGLAGLTGCSTVNTVERAQSVAQKQMTDDKRVITDASLNRNVNVMSINETTVSTGFTKVQVELLNQTSSPYSFRYHFDWFDGQGMLVQTPTSSWIDRNIQGKETMDIISIAPTETAKDFRLKLISK